MVGLLLIVTITSISITVASQSPRNDTSQVLSESQMATMFGGGLACPNRDCDTESGSCPGGDTCTPGDVTNCRDCKSGNGKKCGELQQSWGWMCTDGTESCNGALGSCCASTCEAYTGGPDDGDSCGTRPDC